MIQGNVSKLHRLETINRNKDFIHSIDTLMGIIHCAKKAHSCRAFIHSAKAHFRRAFIHSAKAHFCRADEPHSEHATKADTIKKRNIGCTKLLLYKELKFNCIRGEYTH